MTTETDEVGQFTVRADSNDLVERAPIRIRVRDDTELRGTTHGWQAALTLPADGPDRSFDLGEVVLARPRSALECTVKAGGRSAARCAVTLLQLQDDDLEHFRKLQQDAVDGGPYQAEGATVDTDEHALFVFPEVERGRLSVLVLDHAAHRTTVSEEFVAGEDLPALELQPGARLHMSLAKPKGAYTIGVRVVDASGRSFDGRFAQWDTTLTLSRLLPGPCAVTIYSVGPHSGLLEARAPILELDTLTLQPGENRPSELNPIVVPTTHEEWVSLEVVDERGAPLSAAWPTPIRAHLPGSSCYFSCDDGRIDVLRHHREEGLVLRRAGCGEVTVRPGEGRHVLPRGIPVRVELPANHR
ncbi:MAG: hypothetical protein KDA28_13670, partial [Phycisphaerales bacterium]|nr:hypothetical protein [Phycisphaerales bacterium]